jgi:hypothetical protein
VKPSKIEVKTVLQKRAKQVKKRAKLSSATGYIEQSRAEKPSSTTSLKPSKREPLAELQKRAKTG